MDFTLRALTPSDGPDLDRLLRTQAMTTAVSITTRYRHDIHAALLAQHPTLFGVVATAPGHDGLAGMATAFLGHGSVGQAELPAIQLENLKVHHDVRRRGLGRRLAEWRIEEGQRRAGPDALVRTGVDATNQASLATARRWATQVLGPVRIVIARVSGRAPGMDGLRVRPFEPSDTEAFLDGVNAFYADHVLYPRQTTERLAAEHGQTALGFPLRHLRVVEAADGSIVGGASVTDRFALMTDHVERVPAVLGLAAKVLPIFPADRVVRTAEVNLAWHAPGRRDAGRAVWDAIRHEWRDRATHVTGIADPRGPLVDIFRAGLSLAPRVRLLVPVRSPVQVDESRPVYLFR